MPSPEQPLQANIRQAGPGHRVPPRSLMPLVSPATVHPAGFGNGHVQSIYPALFRRVAKVTTQRERIETPDGDFLDLDLEPRRTMPASRSSPTGSRATPRNPTSRGWRAPCTGADWDVLAWNFRGCSGEPNRHAHSYHSGATGDLQVLLDHVFGLGQHREVALVGFSLGGNITLKYLGDRGADIDPRICAAVAFSVPCDLASSAEKMAGSSAAGLHAAFPQVPAGQDPSEDCRAPGRR